MRELESMHFGDLEDEGEEREEGNVHQVGAPRDFEPIVFAALCTIHNFAGVFGTVFYVDKRFTLF